MCVQLNSSSWQRRVWHPAVRDWAWCVNSNNSKQQQQLQGLSRNSEVNIAQLLQGEGCREMSAGPCVLDSALAGESCWGPGAGKVCQLAQRVGEEDEESAHLPCCSCCASQGPMGQTSVQKLPAG